MADQPNRPRPGQPRWQPPGTSVPATPAKPPRDYIGPAMKAVESLGLLNGPHVGHENIVAAIIIAQALDRFGEKVIEASAIGNYKRTT